MAQQFPNNQRRPEPGGGNQQPVRSDQERREHERRENERRDSERSSRENQREPRSENRSPETEKNTPRAGAKKPVKNLNLYMRGVAVASLLIVGGVGVYKGRGMMNAKKPAGDDQTAATPGTNTVAASGAIEPKKLDPTNNSFTPNTTTPTVVTAATGATKTEVKPFGNSFASLNKKETTTPAADNTPKTSSDKKVSALGKFNFGGAKSDDKKREIPSPPQYKLDDAGGQYGSDTANPGEYNTGGTDTLEPVPSSEGYAAAPPAAPNYSVGDAGDSYAAAEPQPLRAAPVTSSDGGYSDATEEPTPADVLPSPPPKSSRLGFGTPNPLPSTTTPKTPSRLAPLTETQAATDVAETSPKPGRLKPNPLPSNPLPLNTAETDNAVAGAATGGLTSPARPNFSTPLPSQPADTTGRYADEVDVTPIPSSTAGEVRPEMVGPQTPTIAVEKFAPAEVQVGKPALFEIEVKNVGKVSAYDVTVVDEVPRGTRFAQARPQPTMSKTGGLSWKLGTMKPGEVKVIELELVPETEGEIGSVAQVSFQAQAGSRSVVTRPKLEIRHEAPQQVHAGETATVKLTITNTGTGAASNLVLQSDVPEGFTHEAGPNLETKVNPLRPGESTQISLLMQAVKAGVYEQAFAVQGEGEVAAQDSARIEIVAPSLQVSVSGPKKRFVERQATHEITISNPGTAPAKDVDLVVHLPRGFKFVSANPKDAGGQYDARQHAVIWGLEELPPGSSAVVQLTTLPVEAGDQKLRVEARSQSGLAAQSEQLVQVDAVAELPFTIADLADPIEIGSETAYEIRVSNRGAKDATNVVIAVAFPADLKPLEGEGAAQATVAGQNVQFDPIGRIAPGSEVVVKVHAQGLRAGDHRISVSLVSDDQQQPITREESTRVYADQ